MEKIVSQILEIVKSKYAKLLTLSFEIIFGKNAHMYDIIHINT